MAFVNLLVINLFAFVLLDVIQLQLAALLADVFYIVFKVLIICHGRYTSSILIRQKLLRRGLLVIYTCLLFAGVYMQYLSTDALVVNAKLQNSDSVDGSYEKFIPVIPKVLGEPILVTYETTKEAIELMNCVGNIKDESDREKLEADITTLKAEKDSMMDDFAKSANIFKYYVGFLMLLAVLYRSLDNEAFFNKRKKNKEVKDIGTY